MFLGFLEDEQEKNPGGLLNEIGPIHMLRYRKIKERMALDLYGRVEGGTSAPSADWRTSKERTRAEKDFQGELITRRGRTMLFVLIGVPDDAIMVEEVRMGDYGRCDIVVTSGRETWPIELKAGEAGSSVVSQIDKYRMAQELDMCLGLYDEVIPFVMAESFPPYVSSELSRNGVGMVIHNGTVERMEILK